MTQFLQDLRFGIRVLSKRPGLSIAMLAVLAIGMGATTAMFSIINASLLTPLPYANPDRLVRIWETTPEGMDFSASEPNFLDFRDAVDGLESLAAFKDQSVNLTGAGEPIRLDALDVTGNFFTTLGVDPALGSGFDAQSADDDVVVISHALWQRQFGGDSSILGRNLTLNDRPQKVVGVMPADFRFQGIQLWRPFHPSLQSDRGDHWLGMLGRLKPGVELDQLRSQLAATAGDIGSRNPRLAGWGTRVTPVSEWLLGPQTRTAMLLLMAAVGFLLLLACVNLANLFLARASQRDTELGLRAVLGASRSRLLRQMLTEILLLSVVGCMLGLLLAHLLIQLLPMVAPANVSGLDQLRIDDRVLAFSLGLGVVTSLLFGLLPALRVSRTVFDGVVRSGGRHGADRSQKRLRGGLVTAQIALAMILLVGAGILLQSFERLRGADQGFDPSRVLAVSLQLGDQLYAEPWQKVVFLNRLVTDLNGLPGVVGSGVTAVEPYSGTNLVNDVTPVERASSVGLSGFMQVGWRPVTPGFFAAIGLPLIKGRVFQADDRWDGPRIAVVSQRMAEQMWPDQDAIGKEFFWGGTDGTPLRVIGVVGDYQDVRPGDTEAARLFIPYNQLPWPSVTVLVRSAAEVDGTALAIRRSIQALDPGMPVPAIEPLTNRLSASIAPERFQSLLLGAFALIALTLAAAGIYALIAFSVSQRTREVGVRMALGASTRSVVSLMLGDAVRLSFWGLSIGLLGCWLLTRFMHGLLYETSTLDPAAVIAATLFLLLVALIASYLPARKAASIQPVRALHHE